MFYKWCKVFDHGLSNYSMTCYHHYSPSYNNFSFTQSSSDNEDSVEIPPHEEDMSKSSTDE